MNFVKKSLLWSLISIPISWLGIGASFGLAHGSLPFLIPFVLPGFLFASYLAGNRESEQIFTMLFYFFQYMSYFLVILIGMLLKHKFIKKSRVLDVE